MPTMTLLAVPALAGALLAGPATTDPPDLARVCARVPDRIERVERVQTRLNSDADTLGSIARVRARLDRATAEGHADLAALLVDRLAIRTDVASILPDVLAHLKDAQEVCTR